jgi:ubiquinone/menaquinone biosynthesis C-methylase UbiE
MQRTTVQRMFAWGLDRLYNECAFLYDPVATCISRGRWFVWGSSILPWMQAPVLELGCGTGHLQAQLHQHNIASIGIDASANMLKRARRRAPHLVQAQSQCLPFAPQHFATVVAVFPAPYIMDADTLGEVERVMMPGGQFIIVFAAGAKFQIDQHPLWHMLTARQWQLASPQLTVAKAAVHVIVGNYRGGTS